jgi:superfamily II DNA or RNA helicase
LLPRLEKFINESNETFDLSQYKNQSGDETVTLEQIQEFANSLNIHSNGIKIEPHDYQIDAAYKAIKTGRMAAIAPTSAGKSLILYIYLNWFRQNPENKILLIVPSVSLVHQMIGDFSDYHNNQNEDTPERYCHLIMSGKEKQSDRQITISTWQSLQNIAKGKDKTFTDEYFQQWDVVAVDEAHNVKGKIISQILDLCTNAYTRLGVTGTLDGSDLHIIQVEALFGEVYHVITTKELMDRGAVAQMDIKVLMLTYPDEIKKQCKELKYQEEIDYLVTNPKRLNFTANLAVNLKGNTLILVNFVEKHGQPLYDLILSKTHEDRKVFFIHGDVDGEERNDIRAIVDKEENAIIIGSFGTMSTGVSIKRLHNVIFASPSKSQIRVLQSLGRGLRLGDGKEHCTLYDIGDDLAFKKHKNFCLLHAVERIKMYAKQQFNYKLIKVDIK